MSNAQKIIKLASLIYRIEKKDYKRLKKFCLKALKRVLKSVSFYLITLIIIMRLNRPSSDIRRGIRGNYSTSTLLLLLLPSRPLQSSANTSINEPKIIRAVERRTRSRGSIEKRRRSIILRYIGRFRPFLMLTRMLLLFSGFLRSPESRLTRRLTTHVSAPF